jgi:hypothetical protein
MALGSHRISFQLRYPCSEQARRQSGGDPTVLLRAFGVAVEVEQVPAHGVQPVVPSHGRVVQQRFEHGGTGRRSVRHGDGDRLIQHDGWTRRDPARHGVQHADLEPVGGASVRRCPGCVGEPLQVWRPLRAGHDRTPSIMDTAGSVGETLVGKEFPGSDVADSAQRPDIVDRIVTADRRCVHVKIIFGQFSMTGSPAKRLRPLLGATTRPFYFVHCADPVPDLQRGCIGIWTINYSGGPVRGLNHNESSPPRRSQCIGSGVCDQAGSLPRGSGNLRGERATSAVEIAISVLFVMS